MDYTLLIAPDASTLSSLVNNLIVNGWLPQGGVALAGVHDAEDGDGIQWAQAMVKHEADKARETAENIRTVLDDPATPAPVFNALRESLLDISDAHGLGIDHPVVLPVALRLLAQHERAT